MVLLVRYGELALKSRFVRRQLEDLLVTNIRDLFAANGVECIVRPERGRVFVHVDEEHAAVRLLRRVFGIVSVSAAMEGSSGLETLTREVVVFARNLLQPGMSFAIRPRRSGTHPYTSQDLARGLGRAVQDAIPNLAVDLDVPDREIHVEVRGPKAYVFHEVVAGPGGLPLGSQGEVLAPVDDDPGMVAAWLVMRRGCRVLVAAREPYPEILRRWDPRLIVVEAKGWSDLLRLAREKGLGGVVVPATEFPSPVEADELPLLLYPLLGLTPPEIDDLARAVRDA